MSYRVLLDARREMLTIAAAHNGKASFPLRCAPSIRWIRAASSGEICLLFANLEMFDRG